MSTTNEHRAAPRVPLAIHVHLRAPDNHETVLMSRDWTPSSVFVRTRALLSVGTPVSLFVVTTHPPQRIPLSGTVQRVVRETDGLPPGMVIALDDMPAALLKFIGREDGSSSPSPIAATILPSIVVVGGTPAVRAAAVRSLELARLDVTATEDAAGALHLLEHGTSPDAIIILLGTTTLLESLEERLTLPGVVISIGTTDGIVAGRHKFPIVLLPSDWPLDHLAELLETFVDRRPTFLQPAEPKAQ